MSDVPASNTDAPASCFEARGFYDAHVDAVFAYVERRVGVDLAADVVADVFRIAIEQVDGYDPRRGDARAWLFGIATNLLRRHWRTEVRRLRAMSRYAARVTHVPDPSDPVVERIVTTEAVERLLEAVSRLPPEDRDLLVLVGWEQCSHRQVAEVLGIPSGTVRSRLHRIRRVLRSATAQGDSNG